MAARWRSALAVFLATCVVVAGVVIVVLNRKQEPVVGAPRASPTSHRPTLTGDSGCRLKRGPERVPDVPPGVSRRVDAAWERIERWLAAHAPTTAAALGGPASARKLSFVQQDIGVRLPADLVASLLRHGEISDTHKGSTGTYRGLFYLPPAYRPLWADEIIRAARSMCESLAVRGDAAVGSWWHGQFVPVASGPRGWLLYDQRGGAARFGRQDPRSGVSFDRMPATSLTELLEQTADVLEGRRPVLDDVRPSVTAEGTLIWEPVR